jgi:hypothetical protein
MTADELGVPVELRDGSRVRIRQGHRTDRELLVRGFEHLGPESRYRRFLTPTHALGDRTVRYMTELDHHDHEAMIALDVRGEQALGVAGELAARGLERDDRVRERLRGCMRCVSLFVEDGSEGAR